MKLKLIAIAFASTFGVANAAILLQSQYGVATDQFGAAVADGTLWALVADSDANSTFNGGFGLDSTLSLEGATNAGLFGSNITLGSSFGSDTVFAIGGFNGTAFAGLQGLAIADLELTIGVNGVATGRSFAFYWFPGVDFVEGQNSYAIGLEVGGLHRGADVDAGLEGMIFPADLAVIAVGAGSPDVGGSVTGTGFQAVAIPEPSAALLGALGALGLLRRRRI